MAGRALIVAGMATGVLRQGEPNEVASKRGAAQQRAGVAVIDDTLLEAEEKMDKALTVAKEDFAGIRTGRAHPSMFNSHRRVLRDADAGEPAGLIHDAEPRMVIVNPFDKSSMTAVEKAIRSSNLGVTRRTTARSSRRVPELSEERRREFIKVARQKAEDSRVSMRNIRRHAKDSIDKLVKSGDAGEDDGTGPSASWTS